MGQELNINQGISFEQLAQNIIIIDNSLRDMAVKAINRAATLRNWIIGGYIVEYEQNGSDRAKYGDGLLKKLEERIAQKGMSVTSFQYSRLFYRSYPQMISLITSNYATLPHNLPIAENYATVSHNSNEYMTSAETVVSHLSFSHIRELLTIDDPLVRYFYETECIQGTWGVRELRRQITSNLHIRIGLSVDKMKAIALANSKTEKQNTALQIRDPYTFEFLGLKPTDVMYESDMENALVSHLQEFLLEMGKGFCFEARQKRIIIDDEYYFADLVFYNRMLHCNVIAELKNDEFHHEYIGQLNAYVSYYAENEMQPGDNPPIGILLCTHKGKKMVEYALGAIDNQLFVSTYQLQLPNREQLEQFIKDECQNHSTK
ncbi:MAG: PDDEXK nuclease domain-containing protein [Bacteroidales bacterium]|nr:PDDEXK nuclease domain-containing protein [Bacteroidales bacterium]